MTTEEQLDDLRRRLESTVYELRYTKQQLQEKTDELSKLRQHYINASVTRNFAEWDMLTVQVNLTPALFYSTGKEYRDELLSMTVNNLLRELQQYLFPSS